MKEEETMTSGEKANYVFGLVKKNDKGKTYLTIGDLYDIYNRCKLRALVKIIKNEGEVTFYDEEEGSTSFNITM
jgi:hypothetical protein